MFQERGTWKMEHLCGCETEIMENALTNKSIPFYTSHLCLPLSTSYLPSYKNQAGDCRGLVTLQVATLKNTSSLPRYFQFVITCCWKSLPRSYKVCVTNTHSSAGRLASQELLLVHLRKK